MAPTLSDKYLERSTAASNPLSHPPRAPVNLSRMDRKSIMTPPRALNGLNAASTPLPINLRITPMPFSVFLKSTDASPPILNTRVICSNPLDNAMRSQPSISGRILSTTPAILSIMVLTPVKMLTKPSIAAALPPNSFQILSALLRASVEGAIMASKASLMRVSVSVACCLSPMMYSQDTDQPD